MSILAKECTACSACMNICNKNAISMCIDSYGFYSPVIDETKCIGCGKCTRICPEMNDIKNANNDQPDIYAVTAADEIRYNSSSGGVFTLLAEHILNDGGIVYGCAFDSELKTVHIGVENICDLDKLKKSKYVESKIGYVYREIEKNLLTGRKVLFSGVGCQVAGLKAFLQKDYSNLYLVDILCGGALPVGVYEKYLKELSDKFNKKITKVDFRDKQLGWICGSLSLEFDDGSVYREKKNIYMSAFFNKVYQKKVCETCKYAEFPRQGDITIGDFWHVEKYDKKLNDNKGTSLVCANSSKGINLLETIKEDCKIMRSVNFEFVKQSNRFHKDVKSENEKREYFNKLIKNHPIEEAISRVMNRKYDIGLVGNWSGCNYGAHLTHYALYNVLSDMNYDVLMIEDVISGKDKIIPGLFIENPYPEYALSKGYKDISSMKELNDRCDTFIVGSDQLWRYDMFGSGMMCWTLAFANSDKRKISYATSFGNGHVTMPSDPKIKMEYFLKRFQKISVRELSGVDICQNYFGVQADCVLDPVFLCDIKYYNKLIQKSDKKIDEPYIFTYIIAPDSKKMVLLKAISEKLNMKLVCVADAGFKGTYEKWGIECVENCKVEDWLSLLYNSNMVIADSFHAFCFSIIFEKQIISCYETKAGAERIISISELLGLHRPYIRQEIGDCKVDEILSRYTIDYDVVSANLQREKNRSQDWLNNALCTEVVYDKNDLLWDMLGMDLINLKNQYITQKKDINALKLLNNGYHKDKNIILFGAGNCMRKMYPEINNLLEVDYICDNDSSKWHSEVIEDKVCISPEELMRINNPYVIITIENMNVVESIKKQLSEFGLTNVYTKDSWEKLID